MSDFYDENRNSEAGREPSVEDMIAEARRRAGQYNEEAAKKTLENAEGQTQEEPQSRPLRNENPETEVPREENISEENGDGAYTGSQAPQNEAPQNEIPQSGLTVTQTEKTGSYADQNDDDIRARQYNEARRAAAEKNGSAYGQYAFSEKAPSDGRKPSDHKNKKKKNHNGKTPMKLWKKLLIAAAIAAGVGIIVASVISLYHSFSTLANRLVTAEDSQENGEIEFPTPGVSDLPDTGSSEDEDQNDIFSEDESDEDDDDVMTVSGVAEACMPAMVSITTQTVSEAQSYFGGQSQSYTTTGAGSGVVIEQQDSSVLILTNEHVISGSTSITVTFCDDTTVSAEVLGSDSAEDLALVKVSMDDLTEETISEIRRMRIGDTDECKVGEQVVAIGNALGYGQSVSTGIVSALNRQVTVEGVSHTLIQTDAAINPGNSGGALINMQGELIGINEVKYNSTSVEGMGYAIPTSTINTFVNTILNRADRTEVAEEERGYLGVSCVTVPESYVTQGYPSGAYISEVVEGSPAEEAGLKVGYIVSSINGYSVDSSDDLVEGVACIKDGETATLTVLRLNDDQTAYEASTITVTLTSRAESALGQSDAEAAESEDEENDSQGSNGQWYYELPFTNR